MPERELRTDPLGGRLVFGFENQGGFDWSLLLTPDHHEPDLTVWFRESGEAPVAEEEPLSGFLLQFALYEAAMSADYHALAGGVSSRQVEQLTTHLHHVPLRPFMPSSRTRFHVAPGIVLHVSDGWEAGEFDVWAGATHRSALQALLGADVDWVGFDG
ncbi:hypothetical protein [Streptomyces griseosporeus]|uniref:hypothetical protein n=1 Tax=Streptomyces griseosporeus TaxID=1910 RepID=UPI0036CBD909